MGASRLSIRWHISLPPSMSKTPTSRLSLSEKINVEKCTFLEAKNAQVITAR